MDVISVQNLSHAYTDKNVIDDISFRLSKGSITGLLGKNGAGKTTIINILHGFIKPAKGQVYIFGEPSYQLSNLTKSKIGYLIEGHVQYDFMSIKQVEKFYSGFYLNWDSSVFHELISLLKLSPRHKLREMSCGQRSQVALGLILAQKPEIIILDDFTMGLDPGYRRLFIDYLLHYVKRDDVTVFVTSHIVQDMEKLIDQVMLLDNKKIIQQSSLKQFMKSVNMFTIPRYVYNDAVALKLNGGANVEVLKNEVQIFTSKELAQIKYKLKTIGVNTDLVKQVPITLEDAFIGLTGRY